ncbi:hypothetical protein MESS4_30003 [Mesorhizobium sp. STM 4661]|nr:hypothetical protein MESS4_30003 [Mesorhizobium sp. STM 4661]
MELGAPRRDAAPVGGMSALDDMALSDEALEAWMAAKTNRTLVRTMSALDGFVTAAVTGPCYPDPQDWMCPLMGCRATSWPKALQPITPCLPASAESTAGSTRRSSTDRRIMHPASQPSPAAASTPGRGARGSTRP